MLILGLAKTTLLDYPGRVAATIFTGGCNFRCPYCHNRDIVLESESVTPYSIDDILAFLHKRRNVLTGVCITGGEPTLHKDLPDFIQLIKELGYNVKLDTNGTNPHMLKNLIETGLIDYCAMDIKNSPDKYDTTVGFNNAKCGISDIKSSVDILMTQNTIPYEFRTTVVKELHDREDILAIAKWICGAKAYYLQSYKDSDGVLCKGFHAHSEDTLNAYVEMCRNYVKNTKLRGEM